jgi:hypothetical protein
MFKVYSTTEEMITEVHTFDAWSAKDALSQFLRLYPSATVIQVTGPHNYEKL